MFLLRHQQWLRQPFLKLARNQMQKPARAKVLPAKASLVAAVVAVVAAVAVVVNAMARVSRAILPAKAPMMRARAVMTKAMMRTIPLRQPQRAVLLPQRPLRPCQ